MHYNQETVRKLANDNLLNLEKLIAHCTRLSIDAGAVFTPSDYGLSSEITYQELDKFLKEEADDKENILSF